MRIVVTGAAGFVGSHLSEALLRQGAEVVGIDCFTPYYERSMKALNVAEPLRSARFRLEELDLADAALDQILSNVDIVYHLAAQPGVRTSWSEGFRSYERCNIIATQRLLEACVRVGVGRVVYASSSSVYGNSDRYPVVETDLPRPHSPYGVTKLAAEHLCGLYASNHGLHTVSLRYFTVYGPRQRPDMAFHRLIEAALRDEPFPLYGDGSHVRDFTYVGDVISANLAAGFSDVAPGSVLNIAAGGSTVMRDVIGAVEQAVGRPVRIDMRPEQPGDVRRTGGSNLAARQTLDWVPAMPLQAGIAAQVKWHQERTDASLRAS